MLSSNYENFILDESIKENKSYVAGWTIDRLADGTPCLWHNGRIQGYSAFIFRVPQKNVTFAMLANTSGHNPDLKKVTNSLGNILFGEPYEFPAGFLMVRE